MIRITKQENLNIQHKEIALFCITNSSGAYTEVTNYGAIIVSIVVPDKNNELGNVALTYPKLSDYFTDSLYLGCTVGRFANRISNAQFKMDGKTYYLDENDGENSNHGGFEGLNKKIFDYKINKDTITFYTESPDGEGGFCGNLKLWVTYSFSDQNELKIEYKALSDKKTPVNFTNHTYFNLSNNEGDILDHLLQVNSNKYLEMNNVFLPTGRILPVANSAFDFRDYKPIKEMMSLKKDNLEGYNTFFIRDTGDEAKFAASIKDTHSGRKLDVYTSMSGVQLYTGDFLSDNFNAYQGLCLEAQYHPDGMNHSDFDVNILSPNEEKIDIIKFCFS